MWHLSKNRTNRDEDEVFAATVASFARPLHIRGNVRRGIHNRRLAKPGIFSEGETDSMATDGGRRSHFRAKPIGKERNIPSITDLAHEMWGNKEISGGPHLETWGRREKKTARESGRSYLEK